eukprot:2838149-Rhodomonas_salina.1
MLPCEESTSTSCTRPERAPAQAQRATGNGQQRSATVSSTQVREDASGRSWKPGQARVKRTRRVCARGSVCAAASLRAKGRAQSQRVSVFVEPKGVTAFGKQKDVRRANGRRLRCRSCPCPSTAPCRAALEDTPTGGGAGLVAGGRPREGGGGGGLGWERECGKEKEGRERADM